LGDPPGSGSEERTYTVAEANALLPHLAPALIELQEKFPRAAEIRERMARIALQNGGAHRPPGWDRLLARVDELLGRLQRWNVVLRDLDEGVVDFPAVMQGKRVFLCWRLGEPKVAHYHSFAAGFAGRRPLPEAYE
jgi:hypothetical protein